MGTARSYCQGFACAVLLAAGSLFAESPPQPIGYRPVPVPEENPWTPAKAALGERLFNETRLSITGDYSCASCHDPQRYFTDGRVVAVGATGMAHSRNTPSLYNSGYNVSYGWADLGLSSLEMQHRVPMFNQHPVELGYSESLLEELDRAEDIRRMAVAAFGESELNTAKIVDALASFVRTLGHPGRPFDRFVFFDDRAAFPDAAARGMSLFFSARLGCSTCHASINFSGPIRDGESVPEPVFHVMHVSESGEGFRAPSLRMIRFTAPYMHDGSMSSLDVVIDHYLSTTIDRVPHFRLTALEKEDLIEFLNTL